MTTDALEVEEETIEPAAPRAGAWDRASLVPLVAAAVFGAIGEGAVAARATGRPGSVTSLVAALEAALLIAPLTTLAAALVALALARRPVRAVGRLVAGGHPDVGGAVVVLAILAAGGAFATARNLGGWLVAHVSPRFAVLGTIVADDVLLVAALALVVIVGPRVGATLARVTKRGSAFRAACGPQFVFSAAAFAGGVACLTLLPISYATAPSSACFGFVVGALATRFSPELFGSRRWRALLAAPLALGVAGVQLLPRVPDDARLAVLFRAPYTSLLLGAAHFAVDHDDDGYSPILFGGDCDDDDRQIQPGAIDVPDNGIDENCSGADAHAFQPAVAPSAPRPASFPARANIVLIQLDAMRPDHLGFVGYPRATSPNIDRFRQTATWFRRAYTPSPSTRFAMSSMFTGLEVDAVPHTETGSIDYLLLPEAETIAERLAEVGYDRVGLSISYVMQHIKEMGQGFRTWAPPWPVEDWANTYENAATLTTDAALEYLRGQGDGHPPFFLFVHYQCTHDPFSARREFRFGDGYVDRYDSAAAYCDHESGRLIAALDARADKSATAIVVFSDHGELFNEHGLSSHGNSLFEPDVRVLLLVRLPGGGAAQTVEAAVSLTDLAPTVLELAGLEPRAGTDTWSLVPYAIPGDAPPRPPRQIFLSTNLWRGTSHYFSRGVVDGHYKLVRDLLGGAPQLYDVESDPLERTNLAPAAPVVTASLLEAIEGHAARSARR